MKASTIENETRAIGKPVNWDDATQGKCGVLSVHDTESNGLPIMLSCWELEPGDLEKLAAGAPIYLGVYGRTHPVVTVYVGDATTQAT